MPKKRVVASSVGNFSPVNSSTAILVNNVRHFRGDIGEELNKRAVQTIVSATINIAASLKGKLRHRLERPSSGLVSSLSGPHPHLSLYNSSCRFNGPWSLTGVRVSVTPAKSMAPRVEQGVIVEMNQFSHNDHHLITVPEQLKNGFRDCKTSRSWCLEPFAVARGMRYTLPHSASVCATSHMWLSKQCKHILSLLLSASPVSGVWNRHPERIFCLLGLNFYFAFKMLQSP